MNRSIAFCAVLLAAGCSASTSGSDELESLRRSVTAYNEAYRWKNFERAASFLPEDLRLAFIAAYEEDAKSLHIEGYKILQVKMLSEEAANVQIRVTYLMLPSVVVQNRRLTQHWHKVGDAWVLEVEDNSIRDLEPGARPDNPEAFGGGAPTEDDPNTSVYVTDPDGNVVRDDAKAAEAPAKTTPPPPR